MAQCNGQNGATTQEAMTNQTLKLPLRKDGEYVIDASERVLGMITPPELAPVLISIINRAAQMEQALRQCRNALIGYKTINRLAPDSVMQLALNAAQTALRDHQTKEGE